VKGLIFSAILISLPVPAFSDWASECAGLYLKRNAFYNRKGLCFTRQTSIDQFPNNPYTCTIRNANNLPISANEKRWVDSIVETERELGCPRLP